MPGNPKRQLRVKYLWIVEDWKYDYGADDRACVAMLLWMVLKLKPKADIDIGLF